jgi:hypothetical protein
MKTVVSILLMSVLMLAFLTNRVMLSLLPRGSIPPALKEKIDWKLISL